MQQLDAQLPSLAVGFALRALGAVAWRLADLPVAQLVVDAWTGRHAAHAMWVAAVAPWPMATQHTLKLIKMLFAMHS